ncbi:hypothetical protein [Pontibacter silvestris]|nr:hypothetical protein [Pontibacter silvestris]MCC9135377.1 hypothetical protein [Pontibacter silvestris]
MGLSSNYKFLLYLGCLFAFITCFVSGLVTFLFWGDVALVPLSGTNSSLVHHLLSSFIYGFVLSLLTTSITRRALLTKKVLPLHWHLKSQTLIDRLPSNILHRSFMLGLAGTTMAGVSIFLFDLEQVYLMPLKEFIIFKSIFAALLGAAVTVMAVYRAMVDSKVSPKL